MTRRDGSTRVVITGVGPMPAERFSAERLPARRGTRYLSAATRLALAAARAALEDAALWEREIYPAEQRGVCLGTNFAVEDVLDGMDRTVLSDGSSALLAIETPNFSVNIPASYVSLACHFLALNVTVTDMFVAGLAALDLAASCLRRRRAQLMLAGAAEGPIPPAFARWAGGAGSAGACLFVLESLEAALARQARVLAEVRFHGRCFIPAAATLTRDAWAPGEDRLRRLLDAALADARAIALVVPDTDSPIVRCVAECVARHAAARSDSVPCRGEPTAPGGCLAPVLRLAESIAHGGETLLVAPSPQGHVTVLALGPALRQAAVTTKRHDASRPSFV